MYDTNELLERSYAILKGNEVEIDGNKLVSPSKTYATYEGVWNWDSAFIALAVAENDVDFALAQCDIFLDKMSDIGMTMDAFTFSGKVYDKSSKPPIFAWVLREIAVRYNRFDIVEKYYDKLVINESFWVNYRSYNGLFHYDAFSEGSDHLRDSKNESGWDTSVRWDNGARNLYAIDLNCYMILFYETLIFFADYLGRDSGLWRKKKDDLTILINSVLWNEKENVYMDYDYERNCFTGVFSPASFMPLFVNIAPIEKAKKMEEIARSDHFYPLMPSVSYLDEQYNENDYWRGPTWINVAYFAIKGLKNYGFTEIAEKYKDNILTMCYNEKRSVYEYYNSKTGKGLNADNFAWSAVFIIEFIKHF